MNNERFGITFSTESSEYYYDSGTGKVIQCSLSEKNLIDKVLNNKISLEEAKQNNTDFKRFIEKENLFLCPKHRKFKIPTKDELRDKIISHCEQIILELTENCDLRCGYCIYNEHHTKYRSFSGKNMDFETAKKSIDYILTNYKGEKFTLTFYGGEPLVNFQVMKQCIDYTLQKYRQIKINISFTTNLTLMTREIAKYFASLPADSVDIMCSIDGPQNIHDKYRKYQNGVGSHHDTIRGLEVLLKEYYNIKERKTLSINCVVSPPYERSTLWKLKDYFEQELCLPKEIQCNYAYMDLDNMKVDLGDKEFIEDNDNRILQSSPLEEWAVDRMIAGDRQKSIFDIVSIDMGRISNRIRENDVVNQTFLHGNCIPGNRRTYVTVDGKFRACEKIGDSPYLGDCERGFNIDKIYKIYIEDYSKLFENICDKCWARMLCSVCYERTMDENGILDSVEEKVCDGARRIIKDMLINYYRYMERDRNNLQKMLEKYEYK